MRLNGLKEWGTIGGVPAGSFKGDFGRNRTEHDGVERGTLIFATACLLFATAVIALMLALGH